MAVFSKSRLFPQPAKSRRRSSTRRSTRGPGAAEQPVDWPVTHFTPAEAIRLMDEGGVDAPPARTRTRLRWRCRRSRRDYPGCFAIMNAHDIIFFSNVRMAAPGHEERLPPPRFAILAPMCRDQVIDSRRELNLRQVAAAPRASRSAGSSLGSPRLGIPSLGSCELSLRRQAPARPAP